MERRLGMPAVWSVVGAAIAAAFAAASLWVVFEQDIFWQVRAGDELWRTHTFPEVDTWSYSARGQPWLNIQWLSTLLLRAAYACGAERALVWSRGIVVATLFGLLGRAVVLATPRAGWGVRLCAMLGVLPVAYVALLPRLQLRSDFLVLVVDAALLVLWLGTWQAPSRRWATLALVWSAANLHAGTAPFVAVLAVTCFCSERRGARQTLPWVGASAALLLATPYTYRVVPVLYEHFFYYDYNLLQNTDQLPLTAAYFAPGIEGWPGFAAALLCLLGMGAVARRQMNTTAWPGPYQAFWPTALTLVALLYMAYNRVRSIPYGVVFLVPLVAAYAVRWRLPRVVWATALVGVWVVWGRAVESMAPLRGFGVHEGLYPVGSARFIQRVHPQPNVFHTFACGAYLVWHMRDYPLYVDTRETMYRGLQAEVISSFYSAEMTQALIKKYAVNTVLMPIPDTQYTAERGFDDVIERYLPRSAWALVYFDKASFVMLKRIPDHASAIAAYEYTLLRPNLPANAYAVSTGRTPQSDVRFAQEVARCRADEPDNVYCLIAQSAFLRVTDADTYKRVAVQNLETAYAVAQRYGSRQSLTLLVELHNAYLAVGNTARARAIEQRLGPMEAPR